MDESAKPSTSTQPSNERAQSVASERSEEGSSNEQRDQSADGSERSTSEPADAGAKGKNKEEGEDEERDGDEKAKDAEAESSTKATSSTTASDSANGWQAIYSPAHGAYYFFNSITQETTWTNPLQPEASGSGSNAEASSSKTGAEDSSEQQEDTGSSQHVTGPTSKLTALQQAALAQGIDPGLAHLDPSLLSSVPGRPVDASGNPLFTAKFNRHTGAFAKADSRDPSHFSEYERAKRMSEFYFDVNQWQEQLAEQGGSVRGAEESNKRKRITKSDMERFKEQKKQKKLAKTAWLRN